MMRQPGLSAESQRWEMRGRSGLQFHCSFWYRRKQGKDRAAWGLLALCAVAAFQQYAVETSVARSRPYDCIRGLIPLITPPTDYSFPSGHTAASFAVGVLLFRKLPKRYGIPALVLAALIGFSRLYLGVHYPSDVLAGALLGTGISYAAEVFWLAAEEIVKKYRFCKKRETAHE